MNTINNVKKKIKSYYGQNIFIRQNIGRNKTIEFEGIICGVYPNLFVIKTDNENKSFSYSDVLIKNIILINK